MESSYKHYKPMKSSIMARHDFENRVRQNVKSETDFIIPLSKFDANIKGTANPGYLITRLVSTKVHG